MSCMVGMPEDMFYHNGAQIKARLNASMAFKYDKHDKSPNVALRFKHWQFEGKEG